MANRLRRVNQIVRAGLLIGRPRRSVSMVDGRRGLLSNRILNIASRSSLGRPIRVLRDGGGLSHDQ